MTQPNGRERIMQSRAEQKKKEDAVLGTVLIVILVIAILIVGTLMAIGIGAALHYGWL
jgi:hypothetical protein